MSSLDDELRNALQRRDPPPGFAERTLARAAAEPGSAARRWFPMRWAALAAAVVLLFGGVEFERRRQIRAQGEFAKQQVMLALRITSSKLEFVKEKINAMESARH